jgi:hypothetical protein
LSPVIASAACESPAVGDGPAKQISGGSCEAADRPRQASDPS